MLIWPWRPNFSEFSLIYHPHRLVLVSEALRMFHVYLDCSQSPYFSVGFSRPVRFNGAAAILVCKSERELGGGGKNFRFPSLTILTPTPVPLGSLNALVAFTNQDGGGSIEAYRSRESHGKIRGL